MLDLDMLEKACISIGAGTRERQIGKTTAIIISAVQAFDLDNSMVIVTVPNKQTASNFIKRAKELSPEINRLGYEFVQSTFDQIRLKRIIGLWDRDECGETIYSGDVDEFVIRCKVSTVNKVNDIGIGLPKEGVQYLADSFN